MNLVFIANSIVKISIVLKSVDENECILVPFRI